MKIPVYPHTSALESRETIFFSKSGLVSEQTAHRKENLILGRICGAECKVLDTHMTSAVAKGEMSVKFEQCFETICILSLPL